MKFKVGDDVTGYGLKGKVLQVVDPVGPDWLCVQVAFYEKKLVQWFTHSGRANVEHLNSSIELVHPPKKFVEKTFYVAVQSKPDNHSHRGAHQVSMAYPNRMDAERQFHNDHQVCELKIQIEE